MQFQKSWKYEKSDSKNMEERKYTFSIENDSLRKLQANHCPRELITVPVIDKSFILRGHSRSLSIKIGWQYGSRLLKFPSLLFYQNRG